MFARLFLLCTLAALSIALADAADSEVKFALATPPASSSSFCLFELPTSGGTQRLINLGIVQYVELMPDELRIAYGGGNFGSGHDAKISLKTREEGIAIIQRMRQTARECK